MDELLQVVHCDQIPDLEEVLLEEQDITMLVQGQPRQLVGVGLIPVLCFEEEMVLDKEIQMLEEVEERVVVTLEVPEE